MASGGYLGSVGGIEFSPHLRAPELILHAIATDRAWPRMRKVAGHSRGTKVDLVRDLLLTASNMYRFCVPVILLWWQNVIATPTFAGSRTRSGITGGGSLNRIRRSCHFSNLSFPASLRIDVARSHDSYGTLIFQERRQDRAAQYARNYR